MQFTSHKMISQNECWWVILADRSPFPSTLLVGTANDRNGLRGQLNWI